MAETARGQATPAQGSPVHGHQSLEEVIDCKGCRATLVGYLWDDLQSEISLADGAYIPCPVCSVEHSDRGNAYLDIPGS